VKVRRESDAVGRKVGRIEFKKGRKSMHWSVKSRVSHHTLLSSPRELAEAVERKEMRAHLEGSLRSSNTFRRSAKVG
jgi:hypothetical protein